MPLSSVCQEDKICIDRVDAELIASQLDSFDVLKAHEVKYKEFANECNDLVQHQEEVIFGQDTLIAGFMDEIEHRIRRNQLLEDLAKENLTYINN